MSTCSGEVLTLAGARTTDRKHNAGARLCVEWTEQGGPEVKVPSISRFVSRLTRSMLSTVSYDPAGFGFSVEADLHVIQASS